MTVDRNRLEGLASRFYQAWTTQDVDTVLACYSEDLVYVDPNTRGSVRGRDALRAYLTKLFDRWDMTWAGRELFPLGSVDGAAALWRATIRRKGGDLVIPIEGMDLVLLEGNFVKRNDVHFDRAALAPLIAAAS